ncbi:hypothetical protein P879_10511 [Paragonimus westermani]|uniref:Uncharacterized protein n=1 Tax=Paragonimus westermani TaxID=34504 RepID=A0A8T0D6H7_9TREM|nr:hypothetical protein P879_10511 [Paragonimus westermani]
MNAFGLRRMCDQHRFVNQCVLSDFPQKCIPLNQFKLLYSGTVVFKDQLTEDYYHNFPTLCISISVLSHPIMHVTYLSNLFQSITLVVIIFTVTKAIVVVDGSRNTRGRLLTWPKSSAHQRTQYRVKGTKYDGPYQEHTARIYGTYKTYVQPSIHISGAIHASNDSEKSKRLTEGTTEVSATSISTSDDTPPDGNRAVEVEYQITDVDLPQDHQLIHTISLVTSPRLTQPMGPSPQSQLTEYHLFSPVNVPSSSFLRSLPSTSTYTSPALCHVPSHEQLLPL